MRVTRHRTIRLYEVEKGHFRFREGLKVAKHEAMDIQTVAELLGRSEKMVRNYINHNGLPSDGSGRNRTFRWGDVLEWYVGYRLEMEGGGGNGGSEDDEFGEDTSDSGPRGKEDIRQANLRKTRAEADLKQLQLGKLRGQVISIPDAKLKLDRMMGNLRAKLLGMAPKLANRLEGARGRTEREAAIKDEMETLCREISTGAVVDVAPDAQPDIIDAISASAEIAPSRCVRCFQANGPAIVIGEDCLQWLCEDCAIDLDLQYTQTYLLDEERY